MSFKIKKSLMLKLPKPRRRLRIRRKKRSLQNPQLGAPSQDGRTGRKKNLSLVGRKARSHIVTGCWNQNLRAGWRRGWMWRWALRPPHSAKDSSRATPAHLWSQMLRDSIRQLRLFFLLKTHLSSWKQKNKMFSSKVTTLGFHTCNTRGNQLLRMLGCWSQEQQLFQTLPLLCCSVKVFL